MSKIFLKPLEYRYPPFDSPTQIKGVTAAPSPIKWVVVLGGGVTSDPRIPAISRLQDHSLERLVEGIHLYRELPGSKLVLSGGKIFDVISVAEVMANAAQSLGVSQKDIVLEADSKDTEDEARLIQPIIGRDRFIIVTSASHMPRSMALFTKSGMNPIPAPADYDVYDTPRLSPGYFYPTATGLRSTERAMNEYLGLAWEKIRGKI